MRSFIDHKPCFAADVDDSDVNMPCDYSDHLYAKELSTSVTVSMGVDSCTEQDTDLITLLKKKVNHLTQPSLKMQKSHSQLLANLELFLNPDQIRLLMLNSKSARTVRWSNHTVKKCLQLRYTTGTKGYSHLQNLLSCFCILNTVTPCCKSLLKCILFNKTRRLSSIQVRSLQTMYHMY